MRFPRVVSLYIAREVANALAYAHRKTDDAGKPLELVHCDISPPNVLVSYEGEVKVIDFGIARSALQAAAANEDIGFGKFGYMAPEQLLRGATLDRRADIYATGALLYELLTGERLFNFPPGVDYRRVAREVTAGNFPLPSERDLKLGDRFDGLVTRALRTDPAERFQSAEELRDAIQQQLYLMNPTISADTLAAVVRELFGKEIDTDRQMLSVVSQADLQAFQVALHDATNHTVSYALGGVLTASTPIVLAPERVEPFGPAPSAQVQLPQVLGTRPLGEAEREQLRKISGDSLMPALRPKRTPFLIIGSALGVSLLVIALVVFWPSDPIEPKASAGSGSASKTVLPSTEPIDASAASADLTITVASAKPDAKPAADALQISITPVVLKKPKRVRIRRHRPRRTKKRRRPVKVHKVATVSPQQVLKKFVRVRGQYRRFTRSYGTLFDREWQRILFANTYGKKDQNRYKRLDQMLDRLVAKMSRARRGGG